MARKIGSFCLIISLLGFIGSGFFVYRFVEDMRGYRIVSSQEFSKDSPTIRRDGLNVDTGEYLQVGYTLNFSTKDTTRDEDDNEWETQFEYPYQYRITNAVGEVIHSDSGLLQWDEGMRHWSNKSVNSESGEGTVTVYLDRFEIDRGEDVTLEAELQFDDPSYQSTLHGAEVYFYDRVESWWTHFKNLIFVLALSGAGVVIAVVGLFLTVLSSGSSGRDTSKGSQGSAPDKPPPGIDDIPPE